MTRFALTGTLDGERVEGIWQNGVLTGDPALVDECNALSAASTPIHIPGVIDSRASLAEPLIALATMRAAFDEVLSADGDLPLPDELPDGAIP